MKNYCFTIVIERDEDGRFVAICPGLQGCYTKAEARELIEDAIKLHLEDPPTAQGVDEFLTGKMCSTHLKLS
jgi:predicted RNase H-like HicB family nuclease